MAELRTERLRLRQWRPADREAFGELNADPVVMEFYPATLTRMESDAFVDKIEVSFASDGFGLWAVEVGAIGRFIGYVGFWPVTFDGHFTPAIEVGWRLARSVWGAGYATEGARSAVEDGFTRLGLKEIVSFTTTINLRSRRVMEKIGMRCDPADDFDHPSITRGHPLKPHVLYRLGPRPFDLMA